jgi:hypothetical protein
MKKSSPPWNLAIMDAGNGYVYAVSRTQVENDYADFLMQADGLSFGHAVERSRDSAEAIDTWIHEQFNLEDFKNVGITLQRPSYERLLGLGNFTDSHPALRLMTV